MAPRRTRIRDCFHALVNICLFIGHQPHKPTDTDRNTLSKGVQEAEDCILCSHLTQVTSSSLPRPQLQDESPTEFCKCQSPVVPKSDLQGMSVRPAASDPGPGPGPFTHCGSPTQQLGDRSRESLTDGVLCSAFLLPPPGPPQQPPPAQPTCRKVAGGAEEGRHRRLATLLATA